jgi:hypothetical protein
MKQELFKEIYSLFLLIFEQDRIKVKYDVVRI